MLKRIYLFILLCLSFSCFGGVTEWVKVELEHGHIRLPVRVDGIETFAILDTGSQLNAINEKFVKRHKLSYTRGAAIEVEGVFDTEKRFRLNDVPVNLFGVDVTLNSVFEMPLSFSADKEDGLLLGASFFRNFIVQIDYPNSQMRLISRDAVDMKKLKNLEVKKQRGSDRPIIRVKFGDDVNAWLLLDTGNSSGILLARSLAKSVGWLDKHQSIETSVEGVNAQADTETFQLPALKLGPYTLKDVIVTVPGEEEEANIKSQFEPPVGSHMRGKRVEGILGYDVLKHFILTIDYRKGYAHIITPS